MPERLPAISGSFRQQVRRRNYSGHAPYQWARYSCHRWPGCIQKRWEVHWFSAILGLHPRHSFAEACTYRLAVPSTPSQRMLRKPGFCTMRLDTPYRGSPQTRTLARPSEPRGLHLLSARFLRASYLSTRLSSNDVFLVRVFMPPARRSTTNWKFVAAETAPIPC